MTDDIIDHTVFTFENTGKGAKVYFLIKENKVVYVGQTLNLFTRLKSHGVKDYDSVSFVGIEKEDEINTVEASYIVKYAPQYNFSLPPNDKFISMGVLKTAISEYFIDKLSKFINEKNAACFVTPHPKKSTTYVDVEMLADYAMDKIGVTISDLVNQVKNKREEKAKKTNDAAVDDGKEKAIEKLDRKEG